MCQLFHLAKRCCNLFKSNFALVFGKWLSQLCRVVLAIERSRSLHVRDSDVTREPISVHALITQRENVKVGVGFGLLKTGVSNT